MPAPPCGFTGIVTGPFAAWICRVGPSTPLPPPVSVPHAARAPRAVSPPTPATNQRRDTPGVTGRERADVTGSPRDPVLGSGSRGRARPRPPPRRDAAGRGG